MKNLVKTVTEFVKTHKYALWLFYYIAIYIQFSIIEYINRDVDVWISCPLDYKIPFLSVFVIPYVLWFPFVGAVLAAFVFIDKKQFIQLMMNIYIGMTICYIIYLIFPHGQPLRVELTGNEANIFDRFVYLLYSNDTPTNCAPSIHVLNSMTVTLAMCRSEFFRKHKFILISANILNVLIIASTCFIKQHSVIDAALGLVMSIIMQFVIYSIDWEKIFKRIRSKKHKAQYNEV